MNYMQLKTGPGHRIVASKTEMMTRVRTVIECQTIARIFVICRKGQPRDGMAATVEGAFVPS